MPKWFLLLFPLALSACTVALNGQDERLNRIEQTLTQKANTQDVVSALNGALANHEQRIKALEAKESVAK